MIFDAFLFSDFECDFDMAWSGLGDFDMALNDLDVVWSGFEWF